MVLWFCGFVDVWFCGSVDVLVLLMCGSVDVWIHDSKYGESGL